MPKTFYSYILSMLLIFSVFQTTKGQMQASHWIFGGKSHISFPFGQNEVNVNHPLTAINASNVIPSINFVGTASISDVNGNLKLYSNGVDVFNHLHQKLNENPLYGYQTASQSSLFVPYPGKYNQYILFTVNAQNFISPNDNLSNGFNFGLYYYVIDLNKNNGRGQLTIPPNNRLMERNAEKVSGVYHANGKDIWVLSYFENKFYAYLVTENGVQPPVISQVPYFSSALGYAPNAKGVLKISPSGNKIAISHQNEVLLEILPPEIINDGIRFFQSTYLNEEHAGRLFIYDFDPSSGAVSNEKNFNYKLLYFGLDFSPDGKHLYFRYKEDVFNALMKLEVENVNQFSTVQLFDPQESHWLGDINKGVNGKIYVNTNSEKLSVIDKPNEVNFNFLKNVQPVNNEGIIGLGLPNFISDYLKEELKVYNSFDGHNACINTPLKFWVNNNQEILSIFWDFGDGNTSEDHVPEHIYTTAGIYTVTVTINGVIYQRTITIHNPIDIPVYEMVECDTNGDGLTGYNLENFTNYLGNQAAYVSYHISEADALNNLNAMEDLIIQGNHLTPSVWARIINIGGCISITEIRFRLNESSIINQTNTLCASYENGFYIQPSDIQTLFNQSVFIFETHQDAENFQNHMTENINLTSDQSTITLYVRQQNFEGCDDIIALKLNLNYPSVFSLESSEICPFEGEIIYTLPDNITAEIIQWNNLQGNDANQITNGRSIQITKPGNYSVTVTNEFGCQFTEEFEVTSSSPIQVRTTIDQNSNLNIDYGNLSPNDFEFSIDEGITWINGTTINLPIGEYVLWIRQKGETGCIVFTEKIISNKITNFISPNGDGINDYWQIKGFEKYEWIDVLIYNRQGRKLYETRVNHSNMLWDGKVNGQSIASGSYWYKLTTSTNTSFEGYIVINNQN